MEEYNIVIKFNRDIIQSRDNHSLILKTTVTQDNFLTQFNYRSIVTDEMLASHKRLNIVNFKNLVGICYVKDIDGMSFEEKKKLAQKMVDYGFVEYAYVEKLELMKLPYNLQTNGEELPISHTVHNIPNFIHLQGYKDGITPDHKGIDMEYA
ncbi:MAG TPA: hypothetical protein ACHBX0_12820 [Arsenophonus sp.]